MDAVIEAAQAIYRRSLAKTDVVDFNDMILFPLIKNLRVKFDKTHIFLDEAQDTSRARQALARKGPDTRTSLAGAA
jgi:superfamily I DNA/RNA helicase